MYVKLMIFLLVTNKNNYNNSPTEQIIYLIAQDDINISSFFQKRFKCIIQRDTRLRMK